ncbi:hypothetical protein BDW72DRAFT_159013 [Aspergillus terricola var. indicus]
MEYSTVSENDFTTTVPGTSEAITLTSYVMIPGTNTIPTTTRFLWPSSAVDIYTRWTLNSANGYEPAPPSTETIYSISQQPTETESYTETASAIPTSESTRQASATTGTPPSSTQAAESDGLAQGSGNETSKGALAGAIVGSIVGTALLTLLLASLFFRRRRTPSAARELEHGVGSSSKSGATVSTAVMSCDKSDGGFSLAATIPQPADDETVRSRILTIIDHAILHVDNYYGANSPPAPITRDAIARLAEYDSDYLPAPFVTMLGQRGVSRKAITYALVYRLLQAIRPGGELLPKLMAVQPQVNGFAASAEDALFIWRMVTAHLYNQGAYSEDRTHTVARDQAASSLAADFTSAFSPYALATYSENDRVSHLGKLATSTAELGIWLFAQPCTFEFVWNRGQSEFTVVPQITKTFDEQGKRLPKPQVLVEAVQERYSSTV